MYWLMSLGAVLRIAFAMALLFVIIPALARVGQALLPVRRIGEPGPEPTERTDKSVCPTWAEWFFWNFGVGITLITLSGQLLALAGLNSLLTILLLATLIVLIGRAASQGQPLWPFIKRSAERTFLGLLNIFDGRVNVRRRLRRLARRTITNLRERTQSRLARMQIAGWLALTTIAAALRLYRPFASANLGFSDTYVHLYLLKLLEDGRQVDPAWGPYPRGMHFLLMAINQLTNVDEILLLNFFGAFAGVLMVIAVADATRRLSGNLVAGLIAGFLFATLIGGPGQYFVLGGAFDADAAATFKGLPYEAIRAGEFDIALTAFHRQTSTLPQELAIALLFPAVLFLRDFLRARERWHLYGFAGCTAAIATVHTGVLAPLVVMSVLMLAAMAFERSIEPGTPRRAVIAGILAVIIGSSWTLGYFLYPYVGGKNAEGSIGSNAYLHYYFPFLRSAGEVTKASYAVVSATPFLILCTLLALLLSGAAAASAAGFGGRSGHRSTEASTRLWIAATFLVFLLFHFASTLGIPQLIEMRRNAQWLAMAMTILIGIAIAHLPKARAAVTTAILAILLVGWTSRVPLLSNPAVHDRIVNYSGYGASALAVLRIERSLEPYTWTIVSYGQEFPMVMRRGFHLPAVDFLDRYDPQLDVLPIPTPDVFLIVEKTAHPFQINTWASRFSRTDLEQRLQTWAHLYQATHGNMRVFLEDDSVRVYRIHRTADEIARATRGAKP